MLAFVQLRIAVLRFVKWQRSIWDGPCLRGTCFCKLNTKLVSKSLTLLSGDLSLLSQVYLVTNQYYLYLVAPYLARFLYPGCDMIETCLLRYIVAHHSHMTVINIGRYE